MEIGYRLRLGIGLCLLVAGTARAQEAAPAAVDTLGRVFAYDTERPLHLQVAGVERGAGVAVEDVTFETGTRDDPVRAYVVRPDSGAGPFAAVLFVHWFAPDQPTSNRTQFLDEARGLARRGVVSLLVSTFWSDSSRYRSRRWEDDYQNTVDQTRALRRALDVLLAQPGVDAQRVAIVGHDYGAMFGALAAAADPRPKALVFIAGTSRFPNWYLYGSATGRPAGEALERFRADFAAIDPVSVIGRTRAAVFFQFGEADFYTSREDFVALYRAAPEASRIATYADDHPMDDAVITHDRLVWIAEQLGLPEAPAAPRSE